jgi:hypothetical protein
MFELFTPVCMLDGFECVHVGLQQGELKAGWVVGHQQTLSGCFLASCCLLNDC